MKGFSSKLVQLAAVSMSLVGVQRALAEQLGTYMHFSTQYQNGGLLDCGDDPDIIKWNSKVGTWTYKFQNGNIHFRIEDLKKFFKNLKVKGFPTFNLNWKTLNASRKNKYVAVARCEKINVFLDQLGSPAEFFQSSEPHIPKKNLDSHKIKILCRADGAPPEVPPPGKYNKQESKAHYKYTLQYGRLNSGLREAYTDEGKQIMVRYGKLKECYQAYGVISKTKFPTLSSFSKFFTFGNKNKFADKVCGLLKDWSVDARIPDLQMMGFVACIKD